MLPTSQYSGFRQSRQRNFRPAALLLSLGLLTVIGCQKPEPEQYGYIPEVEKLSAVAKKRVGTILLERSGSPELPKLIGAGDDRESKLRLVRGREVYRYRCQQCHGVTGDGNGPVAKSLIPRPRDYRRGIFKFTSTPYGSKPRREDLLNTLNSGIIGTSMPKFSDVPKEDLEAVVDYVLSLTHRGELEFQLAYEADGLETAEDVNDTLNEELVDELVTAILDQWRAARGQQVLPMTPQPEFTAEHVAAGKKAFLSKGCSKCHGEDGRGQTKENIGKDAWGLATKAADLTSGMLRGGANPSYIYHRIDSGINGTPMPSFHNALLSEPDTTWNLVAYVLYVSNRRRSGITTEAGLLVPMSVEPVVEVKTEDDAG